MLCCPFDAAFCCINKLVYITNSVCCKQFCSYHAFSTLCVYDESNKCKAQNSSECKKISQKYFVTDFRGCVPRASSASQPLLEVPYALHLAMTVSTLPVRVIVLDVIGVHLGVNTGCQCHELLQDFGKGCVVAIVIHSQRHYGGQGDHGAIEKNYHQEVGKDRHWLRCRLIGTDHCFKYGKRQQRCYGKRYPLSRLNGHQEHAGINESE